MDRLLMAKIRWMGMVQGIICHKCPFIIRKVGIQKHRKHMLNYSTIIRRPTTLIPMKKDTILYIMNLLIMMDMAIISIQVPKDTMNIHALHKVQLVENGMGVLSE